MMKIIASLIFTRLWIATFPPGPGSKISQRIKMILFLAWLEKKVQFIHSISNLGGTRSRSKDKIFGIIGMEQQGIWVELITDIVSTDCNFTAPSVAYYKQCQSKKELEVLEVDNGGTFKGSSCFIPSPLLCCVLINARTSNP